VDSKDKWKGMKERCGPSWAMIFGFLLVIYIGHFALVLTVVLLQAAMFREIVRLGSTVSRERKLKGYFVWLQWYWFGIAMFFSYGSVFQTSFGMVIPRHAFISFSLYAAGFVAFVLLLKQGQYKYQFGMFAWCHLTLIIIVVQSSFLVANMFQGLIWAILPAMLIITNDMCAYQVGLMFGRTPLIALSPKKTWAGFIGGMCCTFLFASLFAVIMAKSQLLVCPQHDLTFEHPTCTPSPVFQSESYKLPEFALSILPLVGCTATTVDLVPIQFHAMALAAFASIVAPFGGFFASGFKRAFKIKDFGNVIPGHGGITDRMDCQIIMGLFAYVYYWSFVHPGYTAGYLFKTFSQLDSQEQVAFAQMVLNSVSTDRLVVPGFSVDRVG